MVGVLVLTGFKNMIHDIAFVVNYEPANVAARYDDTNAIQ